MFKKKILSFILLVSLSVGQIIPAYVMAEDMSGVKTEEIIGENIDERQERVETSKEKVKENKNDLLDLVGKDSTWTVNEELLEEWFSVKDVNGGLAITAFTPADEFFEKIQTEKNINIKLPNEIDGKTVVAIADGSNSNIIFEELNKINNKNVGLEFNEDLKTIGKFAFRDLKSLTEELDFKNVEEIRQEAFAGCINLKGGLDLSNVKEIGNHAFLDDIGLDGEIVFSNQITKIVTGSFKNCKNLSGSLDFKNISEIENGAFYACKGLVGGLDLSEVDKIGGYAFSGCEGLDGKIILSDNLIDIEDYVFSNCKNLKGNIDLKIVENIGDGAFYNCESLTGDLDLSNIKSLGKTSFANCEHLDGILIFPSDLEEVKEETFMKCMRLEGVVNLEGVKKIGTRAFVWCYYLDKLIIPNELDVIGQQVFQNEYTDIVSLEVNKEGIIENEGQFKNFISIDEDSLIFVDKGRGVIDLINNDDLGKISNTVLEYKIESDLLKNDIEETVDLSSKPSKVKVELDFDESKIDDMSTIDINIVNTVAGVRDEYIIKDIPVRKLPKRPEVWPSENAKHIVNIHGLNGRIEKKNVANGEKIVRPVDLENIKGYEFKGWYEDKEFTKKFDFNKSISSESLKTIDIYGRWTKEDVSGNDGGTKPEEGGETIIPPVKPEVEESSSHKAYIEGYEDGTVRPEKNVLREEVATMVYRVLEKEGTASHKFKDVNAGRWSEKYIGKLASEGIIEGYGNGNFKPASNMTRAEFAALIARAKGLDKVRETKFKDSKGHWGEGYINAIADRNWIEGYQDGSFRPDNNISRAEMVTILNRVLDRDVKEENILKNVNPFKDLSKGKWYYANMLEASVEHKYSVENDIEIWIEK